eukprot:2857039-Pleurochrysis_carterae.AAC.1
MKLPPCLCAASATRTQFLTIALTLVTVAGIGRHRFGARPLGFRVCEALVELLVRSAQLTMSSKVVMRLLLRKVCRPPEWRRGP